MNDFSSLPVTEGEAEDQRAHQAQHLQQHHDASHSRRPHNPRQLALRVSSDESQRRHQQLDLSPAFSDDIGPPSLPSSSPPSPAPHLRSNAAAVYSPSPLLLRPPPQPPCPPSSHHDDSQQQQQSAVMHEVVAEMKMEMERLMREVEEKDKDTKQKETQASAEVERLHAELRKMQEERQQWAQERERLLDLSNRLQAELRKERRKQQQQRHSVQDVCCSERLHAMQEGGRDADGLRAALQRLIEQNRQLSADIRQLTARPSSPPSPPPPSSINTAATAVSASPPLPAAAPPPVLSSQSCARQQADGEVDGSLLHLIGRRASLGSREAAAAADISSSRQQRRAAAAMKQKLRSSGRPTQDLTGKIRNYAIHDH